MIVREKNSSKTGRRKKKHKKEHFFFFLPFSLFSKTLKKVLFSFKKKPTRSQQKKVHSFFFAFSIIFLKFTAFVAVL